MAIRSTHGANSTGSPLAVAAAGCGNGSVHSDADAQKAYLGLDASIDKAINLGFDGFNAASSANIPTQMTTGMLQGTLVIYDTMATALPMLTMDLKGIPSGTLSGSFDGVFTMTGDLKNSVTLTLAFSGNLQSGGNNTVVRAPGTTHITGTAVSDYGTYNVDVTR